MGDEKQLAKYVPIIEKKWGIQVTKHGTDGRYLPTSATHPVTLDIQKPFNPADPKHVKRYHEAYVKHYGHTGEMVKKDLEAIKNGDWHMLEEPELMKKLGFDSTYTVEHGAVNIHVFDEKQVVPLFSKVKNKLDVNVSEHGILGRIYEMTNDDVIIHHGRPVFTKTGNRLSGTKGTNRLEFDIYDMKHYKETEETLKIGTVQLNIIEQEGSTPIVEGLVDITLNPKYRKQGFGKKIIEAVRTLNPDNKLNVYDVKKSAQGFWKKLGGKPVKNKGVIDQQDFIIE